MLEVNSQKVASFRASVHTGSPVKNEFFIKFKNIAADSVVEHLSDKHIEKWIESLAWP